MKILIKYIALIVCTPNKLHKVLNQKKDKLPENPKIENLLEEWGNLKLSNSMLDLWGCLLPNEIHVKSAPNARCFIVRPSEHAFSCHMLNKSSKSSSTAVPPTKQTTLVIKEDEKCISTKATSSVPRNKEVTITVKTTTVKHNKKGMLVKYTIILCP